jgi:peptide chain release factor 2
MGDIPAEDLRVSAYPNRQAGGQHVGISTGVEIEHIPTGTVARCRTARSQHTNKQIAMDMILSALTHPRFG